MTNTALSIDATITPSEHLPASCNPASFNGLVADELCAWYEERALSVSQIKDIAAMMKKHARAVPYFSCRDTGGMNSALINGFASTMFNDPDAAIKNLDASLWERLMAKGQFQDAMTSVKKAEWASMINTRDIPPFTREHVQPTIENLIMGQGIYFAERVDTVFHALSPDHVTNSPAAFGKRMILNEVVEKGRGSYVTYSIRNYEKVRAIDDLRVVVAVLQGRAPIKLSCASTKSVIDTLMTSRRFGEWESVDGNSLQIKLFKSGTVHVEIHPEVVYKLNDILAMLYPSAITERFRRAPQRNTSRRAFSLPVENNLLSLSTLDAMQSVREIHSRDRDFDYIFSVHSAYKSLYQVYKPDAYDEVEFDQAMTFIGGVKVDEDLWHFDFNPKPVFDVLLRTGSLPGRDEFQFFPTTGEIGEEAADTLRAHMETAGKSLLEPSIGQAALASRIPEANWTGVELSEANAAVSQAKGFHVELGDFIAWSRVTSKRFDGVLMNPPFCDYQASNHVLAAYSLLWDGGVLVAIMPDGYQLEHLADNLPEGARMVKGERYQRAFDGTNVAVRIVTLFKDEG